jgi:hypothetical protein
MNTIFHGNVLRITDATRRIAGIDNDPWFVKAAAKIGGFDTFVERLHRVELATSRVQEQLLERIAPEPARVVDPTPIAHQVLNVDDCDVVALSRAAIEKDVKAEVEHRAWPLATRSLDDARQQLAEAASAWVFSHEAELCDLLHADRSQLAAKIRTLGPSADIETLAALVEEWRAYRRRHIAITGVTTGQVNVNGQRPRFTFPHSDWAADYASAWPTFYWLHRQLPGGAAPFPYADNSPVDIALLLRAFPKVWTPTAAEFDHASDQLTRQAMRLATEEMKNYEASARQGFPSRNPQPGPVITIRTFEPPADVPADALARPSRTD